MVSWTTPYKIQIYTRYVKNPRKHLPYQVIVHGQGSYPYVYDSFKTQREADRVARKLIKDAKKRLKK